MSDDDVIENIDESLVRQNRILLDRITALQRQVARVTEESKKLKERLEELSDVVALHKRVSDLEQALTNESKRADEAIVMCAALENMRKAVIDELPSLLEKAKNDAIENQHVLIERDKRHNEFVLKTAGRLGINPGTSIERTQKAIDDVLRRK